MALDCSPLCGRCGAAQYPFSIGDHPVHSILPLNRIVTKTSTSFRVLHLPHNRLLPTTQAKLLQTPLDHKSAFVLVAQYGGYENPGKLEKMMGTAARLRRPGRGRGCPPFPFAVKLRDATLMERREVGFTADNVTPCLSQPCPTIRKLLLDWRLDLMFLNLMDKDLHGESWGS